MSTTRRKAGQSTPPPSVQAIRARESALTSHQIGARHELAGMCLARLQRAVVTPAMVEAEYGDVAAVFRECLLLKYYQHDEAAKLHRRLSQAIARELWEKGEVRLTRAGVLNALRDFLKYGSREFAGGWDNWTGGAK